MKRKFKIIALVVLLLMSVSGVLAIAHTNFCGYCRIIQAKPIICPMCGEGENIDHCHYNANDMNAFRAVCESCGYEWEGEVESQF